METKVKRKIHWGLAAALFLPILLIGLFYLLSPLPRVMDWWVFGVMAPVEQFLGRMWSIFPFSVAEVLVVLVLTGSVAWLVRAIVLAVRRRELSPLLRRLLALAAVWLWVLAALFWFWNAAYQASSFTRAVGWRSLPTQSRRWPPSRSILPKTPPGFPARWTGTQRAASLCPVITIFTKEHRSMKGLSRNFPVWISRRSGQNPFSFPGSRVFWALLASTSPSPEKPM